MQTVKQRQAVEKRIIQAAFEGLVAAGYEVAVDYGEDIQTRTTSWEVIEPQLQACDQEWLLVWKPEQKGEPEGWIFLVYGNDGWDVICDYSTNLEEPLTATLELADSLS